MIEIFCVTESFLKVHGLRVKNNVVGSTESEIFKPNITKHNLRKKYRKVYNLDICDFEYAWYDLIIFGDVIEHMTVQDAQMVLRYACPRCKDMIIAVPYLWSQPEIYGNKWERHIQNDLTDEIFHIRYPGFENIIKFNDYGYYHKELKCGS